MTTQENIMNITNEQIKAYALTLNLIDIHEFNTVDFQEISERAYSERLSSDLHSKWVKVYDAFNWFKRDDGKNDKFGFRQSALEKNTKIFIEAKIIA
jgi:hypothetical protein